MIIDIMKLEEVKAFNVALKKTINFNNYYNLYDDNVNVELRGILYKEEKKFIIRGEVEANFLFNCDRCLNKMNYNLSFNLSEKFSNNKVDIDNEDLDTWYFQGEKLDLYECICANIHLNIPMIVVCKEDCKGLCKICGNNLNVVSCNCDDKLTSSPFKVLETIFDNK